MPDYITLELSSVESIVQDSSDPGDDPDFIQSAAVIEVTPAIPKGTMIPGPTGQIYEPKGYKWLVAPLSFEPTNSSLIGLERSEWPFLKKYLILQACQQLPMYIM